MHAGSPCEDLARLLTTSLPGEVRMENEQAIVRFFYDEITKANGGQELFHFDIFLR